MTDSSGDAAAQAKSAEWHRCTLMELVGADEEERRRLSGQIHDQVLQDLGVCILKAEICEKYADRGDLKSVQGEAIALCESLDRVVGQLRRIMASVRPVSLVEDGFSDSLGAYVRSLAAEVRPRVKIETSVPTLANRTIQILFVRALQAALTVADSCDEVREVGVAFESNTDLVVLNVQYRFVETGGPAPGAADLPLSLLRSIRIRAECGGGWSRIDLSPGGVSLLFALPPG